MEEKEKKSDDTIEIKLPQLKLRKNTTAKFRENPWMVSTIVLFVLAVVLIFNGSGFGIPGKLITAGEAGELLLNLYEGSGAQGLVLDSVQEVSGVYEVNFEYQGSIIPVYITKDGELAGSLSPTVFDDSGSQQEPEEIPKSDKPEVELFIMSYCPYGTQAEKGILPVVALLGDKIDFKLRAVHYILHGDKEDLENKRQLCIREEQGQDILNKYLVCILNSTDPSNPADVEICEKETGVNSVKLQSCMTDNAEDYFAVDSELSQGYGVQGSPTLIINGIESSAGRSPASYLVGICNAFNEAPEECLEELSSSGPSAGFGYNEGTDTIAQC